MNSTLAVSLTSFMMFATVRAGAQRRDSEVSPKRLGTVPQEGGKTLNGRTNCEGAAHAAVQLAPFCGTSRVPLPGPRCVLRRQFVTAADVADDFAQVRLGVDQRAAVGDEAAQHGAVALEQLVGEFDHAGVGPAVLAHAEQF